MIAVLTLFSSGLLAGRPAEAAPVDRTPEGVVVTGTGEVSAEPDILTAAFGIEVSGTTVAAALDGAAAAATRTRDALLRAGVARADLRTSGVSITARRNDEQQVTGYTVSEGITATIRDLPRAGTILTEAIAAGGDAARFNGVSFAIEDDDALLAEARRLAFADARTRAELYAGEAGRSLGRVIRVSEGAVSYGAVAGALQLTASDAALPVEPGRQTVTATVTVEWVFTVRRVPAVTP